MKNTCLILILLFGLNDLKAQTMDPSGLYLQHVDSTLLVSNADTSYLFNAYALTQLTGGIDTVKLSCQSYAGNGLWNPLKDTVYTWSAVTADSLSSPAAYNVCKPNDNLLQIGLGRLYFSVRRRFVLTVSGSNGIYTKEFIF